ncbi:DNA-directed RNA polymerase II subunit RPB2, partial [Cichlidogyrus casuarinus]
DANKTTRATSLNENVELAVRGVKVIERTLKGRTGYKFPQVILKVHIQRRSLFYGYTVIAPSILLCVFTVFSFWLPSGNAQKIDMGLTVFLFLYFLQLMIAENTPESNSTPLIGTFLTMVMTLNSVSLVFATIVLYLKRRGSTEPCPSPPGFFLSLAKKVLGPLTFLQYNSVTEHFYTRMSFAMNECEQADRPNYEQSDSRRCSMELNEGDKQLLKEQYRVRSFEWAYIAQVVDRTLFLVYMVATVLSIFVLLVILPSVNSVEF